MIELPLRIAPADAAPSAPAAAWFIAGDDPRAWLDEVSGWGLPLDALRLLVVPRAANDRRALGVLVLVPERAAPEAGPRAQPYAVRAGRLYLPAAARLLAPASDAELAEVLTARPHVLHPSAGLVGFEPDDARCVADLVVPPPARPADWCAARPGAAPGRRLVAVEVERPPTVEAVLRRGRDDIGDKPPEELPPTEQEERERREREPPRGATGRARRWVTRQVARGVRWLTSGGRDDPDRPRPRDGRSWVDRLHEWARRHLRPVTPEVASQRERELRRLLEMLDRDPDRGLRYALPLAGEGNAGARGIAPPGARLTPRPVDYDPGRFRGGGPVDAWDVSEDMRARLHERYREVAGRERALGRHRRAAYIYAELLGDYRAAAEVLEQGRYYREAAALYRDRLNVPLEAARCLERGGLVLEAVAIYEAERRYETAGDLLVRVERFDRAERSYRCAAEAHRSDGDLLAAARVLEKKVRSPDEALAVLASGWPWSTQAGGCLQERFALLGRLGRHEQADGLVESLRREPVPSGRAPALTEALSTAARRYPDRSVASRARDATRVVVGRRLRAADSHEADALIRSLTRIAPDDRLLARDGRRFVERQRAPAVARSGKPALVEQLRLPARVIWERAVTRGGVFYAAGHGPDGIVAVRAAWSGSFDEVSWRGGVPAGARLLLAASPVRDEPILLAHIGGPLPYFSFHAAQEGVSTPGIERIGTPDWLPEGALAVAYGQGGGAWIVREQLGGLTLSGRVPGGMPSKTHLLTDRWPTHAELTAGGRIILPPVHVAARTEAVLVAAGTELVRAGSHGRTASVALPGMATGLCVSPAHAPARAAVTLEEGGLVFWLERGELSERTTAHRFGEGLDRPLAGYARGGALVAVSASEARVYRTDRDRVVHQTSFDGPGRPPAAVIPGRGPDEVAVVLRDGVVRLYRIR